MRKCNKCNTELIVGENITPSSIKNQNYKCKPCQKQYRIDNKEKMREWQKEYYKANREKIIDASKRSIANRKDEVKEYLKEWNNDNPNYGNEWYHKNKEHMKVKCKEYHSKNMLNPEYKLKQNVRSRIHRYLKEDKTKHTIEYLGCSIPHYKTYLQQQFDEVMTWDNYGTHWEIDHIHPLAKGGSFHYTNTQPLTIKENRRKGAKW